MLTVCTQAYHRPTLLLKIKSERPFNVHKGVSVLYLPVYEVRACLPIHYGRLITHVSVMPSPYPPFGRMPPGVVCNDDALVI